MTAPTETLIVVPTEGGPDRSCELVSRRASARMRRWLGGHSRPEHEAVLLWPIELAVATAVVKPPLRAPRPVRVPVARDLVTGTPGTIDVRVPDPVEVPLGDARLVAEHPVDDRQWWEFSRTQVVIRHRPTEIRDLTLTEGRRVHLPYDVVRMEEQLHLVDRFACRVDAVVELPQLVGAD